MIVRAENVRKEFIRKSGSSNVLEAVADSCLELRPGTLTVIRGRSGGGKSTLLNMLSGILAPSSGRILYDDRDIYTMKDEDLSAFRNRHIGLVPQGKSAIASLTVMENILLPRTLYGDKDDQGAIRLMEQMGIDHLAQAMPEELSGGELRRMAIARALIRRPEVVLADEPTGDLDDENTRIVFRMLQGAAKKGTAVLMVTHEREAEEIADKVYRMDAGELHD